MSKSKSRQSSRQTSGSGKNGANGAAKQTSTANRTTVKASASTATEEKQVSTSKSVPLTPAPGKALSRDAAKYERRQADRQSRYLAQRRARRNKLLTWTIGVLVVVLIAGGASFWIYQAHQPAHASNNFTPFQEAVFNSNYPPVDNVYCDQLEQSVEHIHVYLDIWINGKQSPLPANIGIPQDQGGNAACFYWLHVHAQYPNVIHIEAPSTEPFTLGQFLNEWNQQFNSLGYPSQLLLTSGWTIWVNGNKYNGSLSSVPLDAHNLITVAYNSPNAKPMTVFNWNGL